MMSTTGATIFVCVSCRRSSDTAAEGFDRPGGELSAALQENIASRGIEGLTVEPVDCLAVWKRRGTLALKARGKGTYLIGDLDPAEHVEEIVDAAVSFERSETGIVPWKERPPTFRRGVIARVPPIGFKQPEPETP
jgi:predicted metal-binding protein